MPLQTNQDQSSTQPTGDNATVPSGPGVGANQNPGALDLTTVPQDNGYANNEIQTLQNFLRTGGSNITPAYKAQVQARLDNLTSYVNTGKWNGATTSATPNTDISSGTGTKVNGLTVNYPGDPTSAYGSKDPAVFMPYLKADYKAAYGKDMTPQDEAYWSQKVQSTDGFNQYWSERAQGKGAGTADAAKYGTWAGGDPNAEGASGSNLGQSSFSYTPFGGTGKPVPTFTAPTMDQALNDPGYQFRLQQGTQALDQSAAAKGTLRGGAQMKALTDYGQASGAQEYQNVYNRSLQDYQTQLAAQGQDYSQAANTYGINAGQNQFGANLNNSQYQFGANLANNQYQFGQNYGLASNAQSYGQNLSTAQFQAGLTNSANGYGQYYYDQNGNLVLGQANSQAGATVSGANAWQNALGNVSQAAIDAWYASKYGVKPKTGGG